MFISGKSVYILETDIDIRRDGAKFNNKPFINGNKNDMVITSIVPGDFNRDSQLDVLIMRAVEGGTAVTVEIHDGKDKSGS